VLVVVLENLDRFSIRLTQQISSIGLFAVTEPQCTEDEHDDEDEDDSKFQNSGSTQPSGPPDSLDPYDSDMGASLAPRKTAN
jgi:hypothetical protein